LVPYRAMLDIPHEVVEHVSWLIYAGRRELHSRWRRLSCFQQALLVLVHLRKNETLSSLESDIEHRTNARASRRADVRMPGAGIESGRLPARRPGLPWPDRWHGRPSRRGPAGDSPLAPRTGEPVAWRPREAPRPPASSRRRSRSARTEDRAPPLAGRDGVDGGRCGVRPERVGLRRSPCRNAAGRDGRRRPVGVRTARHRPGGRRGRPGVPRRPDGAVAALDRLDPHRVPTDPLPERLPV
jgi:hypothetical protein